MKTNMSESIKPNNEDFTVKVSQYAWSQLSTINTLMYPNSAKAYVIARLIDQQHTRLVQQMASISNPEELSK